MFSSSRVPIVILALWLASTLFWWGLAFFPTPQVTPEWLTVARDVCFGTMPNGLPAPSGWMVLILGPLSFLAAFMVAWPNELRGSLRNLASNNYGRAALALVFAAVAAEGVWVAQKISYGQKVANFEFGPTQAENLPVNYPRTNSPAPDFELIDQSGANVRLGGLRGETVLLTFAFAHCQTVCPVLVKEAMDAVKNLDQKGLRILIVTLDPWRDTPKSLPFLAEKWQLPANAHVLSGEVKNVIRALDEYKVPYSRDEKTGDVSHPALTYLISADGQIAYTFNNAHASWLKEAIGRIENRKDVTAARQVF